MEGRQAWREPILTAVATTAAVTVAMVVLLATGSFTPADLITPGGLGPSAGVIAEDFGDHVLDPEATGYDGQQTYAIARYFPDLQAAADHLDNARYRMVRILPPAVASPLPPGEPTVYGLLALNLLGIGLAVAGAARLLEARGAPPQLGALAAAPLLLGVGISTTGPIAWGLAIVALALLVESRHAPAVALFVAAALARETTIVAAGLGAVGLAIDRRTLHLPTMLWYGLPAVVVGIWYVALGQIVGGTLPERSRVFGFLEVGGWDAVFALLVFALGLCGTWVWRRVPSVALASMGFTGWMAIYAPTIFEPLGLLRVNALPIAFGLTGLAHRLHARRARLVVPARNHRHHI